MTTVHGNVNFTKIYFNMYLHQLSQLSCLIITFVRNEVGSSGDSRYVVFVENRKKIKMFVHGDVKVYTNITINKKKGKIYNN